VNVVGEIGWPDGTPQALRDPNCVMQDRRLDVYVCARRDTTLNPGTPEERTWDLPVVYRISGLTTGSAVLEDIIWHPFDDASRQFNRFRNPREFEGFNPLTPEPDDRITDEDASFTGVAVLQDNSVYVTRSGPLNRAGDPDEGGQGLPTGVNPFNSILLYSSEGVNTGRLSLTAFDAFLPSLLSSVYPSDIISYFQPPQESGLPPNRDFFVAQAPPPGAEVPAPRYGVLSIRVVETSDGIDYRVDTERLAAASDPERGDGFLYEEDQFVRPTDLARAGDETGYLFVVDAGTDSLYVFNAAGVEGVAPPPGSDATTPLIVSFGGEGGGPLAFRDPQGVAYFDRIVYVADTGNNRIARYRLNTDFE
ncbi:MAG: hypothetical protein R3362_08635, partial [Rhodothermales bacterium]|nr:hypothetical protein [Rhodothermales bacterium]